MQSDPRYRRPAGYGAQQYADWYGDPYYDDYEEQRESTILRLFRELANYRANRKKNKKKKGSSSSSSDSSDDDRRQKSRRNRQQQQQYQPAGLMNVAQPALVTHYPAYGPPIQSIAYVMSTVPVAAAQPSQPVVQPSSPSPPRPSPDLDMLRASSANRQFGGYPSGQQSPIYQNDDQPYPDPAASQLFPQQFTRISEEVNTFGPEEENLLQTLLQAKNAQLANRMQNPFQAVPRNLQADIQGFQNRDLPGLSSTGAAIANFSQQATPPRPPPILGTPSPSGIVPLPQPLPRGNDSGITNLEWLNEPNRFLQVEETRPITVWPDRPVRDSNVVRLQIDSKLYIGSNIVERLQELRCPRNKLDSTPVSRMIVMLLEKDDVRPENYQLVGEDDIIMKWTAMMGDYNLQNGTKLRLRRRTKPGRVRGQRRSTVASRVIKREPSAQLNSKTVSLPSLPLETQRTFSNLGSIMY